MIGRRGWIGALLLALGLLAAGASTAITLPNGWRIAAPPEQATTVGTFPSGLVLSRDGRRLFVLETGYGAPVLRVLDARTLAEQRAIRLGSAYGAPLRDAAGDGMWVANSASFGEQVAHVDPDGGRIDRTVSLPVPFFASALARSPDGALLAVAGDQADRVALVRLSDGTLARTIDVGRHPAAVAFSADGSRLYVAARAERYVDAVGVRDGSRRRRIAVGLHPVAFARDGDRLFVADADDDDVATIDLRTERVVARTLLPFAAHGVVGASPNALLLDGGRLYVTCGAANAVAVFRVGAAGLQPLGAIPTGWYPTSLAVDRGGRALLIADAKGEGGRPNPSFRTGPNSPAYVGLNAVGAVRRIAIPTDDQLRADMLEVASLGAPYARATPPPDPVVRAGGPLKHVIYIIKENRTYDQVLGDAAGGDGDPSLVMFGRTVTPNQHALTERFGLFDRFFCDAHVSADGHNWSTAAFANDYVEKMWRPQYAGRRAFYDFEDGGEAAIPRTGYIWDDAVRRGVSLRDYGEWVTAAADDEGDNDQRAPTSTLQPALATRLDRRFAAYDLHIPDVVRFTEWKREFDAFERTRTLPQLEIVRFGRDHTAGTRTGENTPEAMVADNDRAVGLLVDAVSHSPDWGSTAIFVLEDDAQNGPDHVDEQRSTLYLASPYARGGLQHEHYTTSSVLRTIELILGLPPMTPYDAGARPLFAAFTAAPDPRPFDARDAQIDVDARNGRSAYRAADSARLDFAHADAVPDAVLNDILWHATRGDAPLPRYGAFDQRASSASSRSASSP
jgi:DNA-binding beta-propeller fold protein YncE